MAIDVLKSSELKTFFYYALPSVLGMLAISSASIVDGFFVGNYVGSDALAAINITMPVFSLMFGLGLMISVGSSVVSGKLIGEGDLKSASLIFTKSIIVMTIVGFSIALFIYLNINNILTFFELPEDLTHLVSTYLSWLLLFIPFLMIGLVLDYFVKVDNRPMLAFGAFLISAASNMVLDWIFIANLELGIFGAALATGISQLALIIVILPHFFSSRATIKFVKPIGSYLEILRATFNGASEFVNEISVGVTTLIFNIVMMKVYGVDGVAAYTVVNYLLWIAVMISFGISDSMQPILSKNYGAKNPKRIGHFVLYALVSVLVVGISIIIAIKTDPALFATLFLQEHETTSINIVYNFLAIVWPVFLFSGANMVFSAYLTALHQPLPSAIIALSRSLLFPVLYIFTLPYFYGDTGIYMAIPVAEFTTLLIALYFFFKMTPNTLIQRL